MKCPKCGYVSHDYLDACRKCSTDWVAFKQELRLSVLEPGDLDLSLVMDGDVAHYANREAFGVDDSFFTAQTLLVDREERPRDDEYDLELDDEPDADPVAASYAGTGEAPNGLETSKGSDFVMISPTESDETQFIDLAAVEEQIAAARGAITPTSPAEGTPPPSVDMIDMSDLGDLGGDTLSSTVESVSNADTADDADASVEVELEADEDQEYVAELEAAHVEAEETVSREMSAEDALTPESDAPELPEDLSDEALANMDLESTVMIENVFGSEAVDAAPVVPEESPPEVSDDPSLHPTLQVERPEEPDALPPPHPAAAAGAPELISDDLFETELELELEDEIEAPALAELPAETAPDSLLDVDALEIEEDDETKG